MVGGVGCGWEEDGDSGKGRLRGEVGRGTRRLGRRAVVIRLGGRWLLGDAAGRGGSPPVTGPARWINNWEDGVAGLSFLGDFCPRERHFSRGMDAFLLFLFQPDRLIFPLLTFRNCEVHVQSEKERKRDNTFDGGVQ